MQQYIFFLGHQPHLSLAELEAVFGADSVLKKADEYAILELPNEPNIDRLGGTTKISKVLKVEDLEQDHNSQLKNLVLKQILDQKSSKIKLGLSAYSGKSSVQVTKKNIQKLLENLRSELKSSNSKLNLRTVTPNGTELSSAQIIHSDLLKKNGLSLDILVQSNSIVIAQTIQVPNLKKYTLRDYGKPRPSGVNGMLPPKLAQIMINLSGAKSGDTILDPFCGSGTVLQESLLLEINCIGSDLNPAIIEDAKENLTWLTKKFKVSEDIKLSLSVADATSHQWSEDFTHVICETYLGKPLSFAPTKQQLSEIMSECDKIAEGFLINIHPQLKADQTLVVALPCWLFGKEVLHLPVVEKLSSLGYNQLKSNKLSNDLVYRRDSKQRTQIVGRDIHVLTKK